MNSDSVEKNSIDVKPSKQNETSQTSKQEKKQTRSRTMADSCWDNAFNPNRGQMDSFISYLGYITVRPTFYLSDNWLMQDFLQLFLSPITIPTAIMASPVFFTARTTYKAIKKVDQLLEQRKITNLSIQDQEKYGREVTQDTLKQALANTCKTTFLTNKKRLIILTESKKDIVYLARERMKNDEQQKCMNQEKETEKEYIFIIDEDRSMMEVYTFVKRNINHSIDGIHFFTNLKLINLNSKIHQLQHDGTGIIRMRFALFATFG